jgi:hypothetical protein
MNRPALFHTILGMNVTHELADCKTAEEFLDVLSPRSKYFHNHASGSWVFRGQGMNSWTLVPTALRRSGKPILDRLTESKDWSSLGPVSDENKQRLREFEVVRKFFLAVDAAGLLPALEFGKVREFLEDTVNQMWEIPAAVWPLIGLAQHYGLPTRLLDWTRSARFAAYFAARQSLECLHVHSEHSSDAVHKHTGANLVVWALNAAKIEAWERLRRQYSNLYLVTVPRAGNPNLHAQEGVFTLYFPVSDDDIAEDAPFDEVLAHVRARHPAFDWSPSDLVRFVTPRSQAGRLMRLLAAEGVTAEKLFPGFRGAAESVIEQLHWEH